MVRRALILSCVGVMAVCLASCGQTYKLDSITIAPAAGYNLTSASPQGALVVTANYSNTKTAVVTVNSTYEILASPLITTTAPSSVGGVPTVSIDKSGNVTASATATACTWVATTSGGTTTYVSYPFSAQATYTDDGVTATATAPINVATAPGCVTQQSAGAIR